MGFEETVEERHVVEPECDGNLFDRQCSDFQLCLGIGEYGVNDDVACRAVAHVFSLLSIGGGELYA